ncbi:MAG: DUF2846 domain-containing protein [Halomonas sp.]|uniref:DUF2846 domain-containing protein n=1 Tax=Halomonas sulfidivorans TaxID=2733488 RepID=A0ABX7WK78_9GAMM|nr:DUF2846 domain-containing protein [Halomonas sulfidivorans]MDX5377812.1 DUF2846 domain-containing protein [Halomonas sp.]QTP60345.1 DUF2846 domain-containing protein [Halomonas sulfidivorans]
MKLLKTTAAMAVLALMTGCASVNMASQQESSQAKQFEAPEEGMAGVYVFRKQSPFGAALKKDIWIDGECIGESARGVFFYHQVEGGQEHEVATESEFSPNTLSLMTESGNNYFVEQYIKIGAFVGGANLRLVDEEQGMEEVSKLSMATPGNCSQ